MTQAPTRARFYAFTAAVWAENPDEPDKPILVTPSRHEALAEVEIETTEVEGGATTYAASFDSGSTKVDYVSVIGGEGDGQTVLGVVEVGAAGELTVDCSDLQHLHVNRNQTLMAVGEHDHKHHAWAD
jgi:hypothetical protein